MPTTCDIGTLVNETPALGQMDDVSFQATKVYLLAQILLALGGSDYTNICALADSLKQYDSLPDYKRRTLSLQILINTAVQAGVRELDEQTVRSAINCAHCCGSTNQSLETAEWFLWCNLINLQAVPCWVAREVYGLYNPKWVVFAAWLLGDAPSWLRGAYLRFGQRFALWIADKPKVKRVVRWLMDKAVCDYA